MRDKRKARLKQKIMNVLKNGLKEGQDPILSVRDLALQIPICRKTFYVEKFHEDNDIIDLLDDNKAVKKAQLKRRWGDDDSAPVLQIALYKLLGTQEEREVLNNKHSSDATRIELKWE